MKGTRMEKTDDYLKRYRDRYRVKKAEDGVWNILTHHKPRYGMTYDVYVYSDTHLAVLLPPKTVNRLLRENPDVFTLHQDAEDAEDAVVLLFPEDRLHDLADVLKLRRRRRISEAERRRLAELSRKHSEEGLRKLAERRRDLSRSA